MVKSSTAHNLAHDVAVLVDRQRPAELGTLEITEREMIEVVRLLILNEWLHVQQIIPLELEPSDSRTFLRRIWQNATVSHADIDRLYITPGTPDVDAFLAALLPDDIVSGVNVKAIQVTEVPEQAISSQPLVETWIINGSLIFRRKQCGDKSPGSWQMILGGTSAMLTSYAWDLIWSKASSSVPLEWKRGQMQAAVLRSARHSAGSLRSCASNIGCSWYHQAWPYLRALDLVSSPQWHETFYRPKIIDALSGKESARVLISGTADFSMLALVFDATAASGCVSEIFVADICASPLVGCMRYAEEVGRRITTVEGDVRDLTPENHGLFDLIVSDAFLTRFNYQASRAVIAAWSRLVAAGGHILTTIRVSPIAPNNGAVRLAEEDRFLEQAVKRYRRWAAYLDISMEDLIHLAKSYSRNKSSYHVGEPGQIVEVFGGYGLEMSSSETAMTPGEFYPTGYLRLDVRASSTDAVKS